MPDDPDVDEPDSPVIAGLRKKAERVDQVESENEQLRRDLALSRSGLALNDTQVEALAAVHKGEWTADELAVTAASLGFGQSPPTAPPDPAAPQVPAEELAAIQRTAAAGGMPAAAADPEEEFQAAIRATTSREELEALLASKGRLLQN